MADDPKNRGAQDRSRISMHEEHDGSLLDEGARRQQGRARVRGHEGRQLRRRGPA